MSRSDRSLEKVRFETWGHCGLSNMTRKVITQAGFEVQYGTKEQEGGGG